MKRLTVTWLVDSVSEIGIETHPKSQRKQPPAIKVMNKVSIASSDQSHSKICPGDLFIDSGEQTIYILCQIASTPRSFACFSLESGCGWDHPKETIFDAVEGLMFFAHNAKISVDQLSPESEAQ